MSSIDRLPAIPILALLLTIVNRGPEVVREPKREQTCAMGSRLHARDRLTGDGIAVTEEENNASSFHSKLLSFRYCLRVFGIKMIRLLLLGLRDGNRAPGAGQELCGAGFRCKRRIGLTSVSPLVLLFRLVLG